MDLNSNMIYLNHQLNYDFKYINLYISDKLCQIIMFNKVLNGSLLTYMSDYLFKVLLIGNSGVGKSCMLMRFSVLT